MNTPQIDTLAASEPYVHNPNRIAVRGIKHTPLVKPLDVIPPSYDELHPSPFVVNGYGNAIDRVMAI